MNNNWVDGFARSLVQHAARRAPASLAERLEEEWLADLEDRRGHLARLRFGVGCCWATQVIAHEFLEPKVAAATATGGAVPTAIHERPDYSFFSGRSVAVLGIIGLHALIIYAFTSGLVHQVVKVITPVMAVIPELPRVIDKPPPLPPQTTFKEPSVIIPDPGVRTIEDPGPTQITGTAAEDGDVPHAPPEQLPPPREVARVMGGPGKGFPNTDDFYPAHEIRTGTTGTATVRVCTDEKGRLSADPALVQTSGSGGLDQGALRLAKAASGHYRATTEDGRAVSSCYPFRVTFSMKN